MDVQDGVGHGQPRQICASHDRQASGLGMERTAFRNASGLHHPQQKTTARDMAVLGRALLRDFPPPFQHLRHPDLSRVPSRCRGSGRTTKPLPSRPGRHGEKPKPSERRRRGAWFRVAQASRHSRKSGTLKGNPGQAHAALGLR